MDAGDLIVGGLVLFGIGLALIVVGEYLKSQLHWEDVGDWLKKFGLGVAIFGLVLAGFGFLLGVLPGT